MDISNFIKINLPRALFLSLVSLAVMAGLVQSALELNKYWEVRHRVPFYFYGDGFAGLSPVLAGEKYLGYYTDKDIQDPKYSSQFEQVQLTLAPVILDRIEISYQKKMEEVLQGRAGHRYILFDCRDEKECWRKISEIKARPLKRNNLGAVLAITKPN